MLILPVHKKIDWKRPPLVTLMLLLVNVLIFTAFQLDDDAEVDRAFEYYMDSGLSRIELGPYRDYLDTHGKHRLYLKLADANENDEPYWFFALQTDRDFLELLHGDSIIRHENPVYGEWKEKRLEFERHYEAITFVHYGLRTGDFDPVSLVSHMFLHAGFWHLFGNAIFLLAVGLLVESVLKKSTYLICYVLGGLGSAAFDFIFNPGSLVPGIGASGAIAGLMGAYAVLYGLKKIRFFYFIGVYFDYISLPAIALLPLWIGNELAQMMLYPNSNVNFLAHLGGLVSGAIIAFVVKNTTNGFLKNEVENDERESRFEERLNRARDYGAVMDFQSALPILRKLYAEKPDNREVLCRLYECNKLYPSSDEFHRLAHEILALEDNDPATNLLVRDTFNEYIRLAKPSTRMSSGKACQLAHRFVRQKALPEAERLVKIIIARRVSCPERNQLLLRFSKLLDEEGRADESLRYRKLLSQGIGQ